MKFTSTVFAAVATFGLVASAAPTTAATFDPVKACPAKGPFALKVSSKSKTYNGKYITGSHIGAAIDLAVLSDKPDKTFYNNYTSYSFSGTADKPTDVKCYYGSLAYQIYPFIPFAGGLNVNLTSNIAQLWLSVVESLPGTNQFTFGGKDKKVGLNGVSNWYGCTESFEGYGPYPAITWLFGKGVPSDKDCTPVTITYEK